MSAEIDKIEQARFAALEVVETARVSALEIMEKSRTTALDVIENAKIAALFLIEEARIAAVKEATRMAIGEAMLDPRVKELARDASRRVVERISGEK